MNKQDFSELIFNSLCNSIIENIENKKVKIEVKKVDRLIIQVRVDEGKFMPQYFNIRISEPI